ncbi:O-antigen ligase family protein [Candidatus Spyradosoma sp. SGI.093]|uniref:O-antigen ligase family protein n=1 Tax=Candidatus Spyradosoma sp. SGI.093 TaxID=3420583 RepID=UPI003D082C51
MSRIPQHPFQESTDRKSVFLLFFGSILAFSAYFFLRTQIYPILNTAGGIIMLAPLITRFPRAIQVLKMPPGKLWFFAIIFSAGMLVLRMMKNGLDSDTLLIGDLYQFSLAFAFLTAGFTFSVPQKIFCKAIVFYGLAVSLGGFFLMKYQGGGLTEVSGEYALSAKNSICVIWAIAGALLFWNYLYGYSGKIIKWLGIGAFTLVCICILYGRGRTAFLALISFSVLALYKKFGKGRWYIGLLVLLILAIFSWLFFHFFGTPELLKESFLKNKNEDDLNSISSGRLELILMGLEGFLAHPFWGCGDFNGTMPIHCYPVRILAGRGLIGGFGYMIFYFYLCKTCMKKLADRSLGKFDDIGVYIMIVPLFGSLGEICQPYGPGSVSGIAFMLFGIYLRKEFEEKIHPRDNPISAYRRAA